MSEDESTFDFGGENFELQYMKNVTVKGGGESYELTSDAEFDFVHVIFGSGSISQPEGVSGLRPGSKVRINGNVSYVLESGADDLNVEIIGVRTKAE